MQRMRWEARTRRLVSSRAWWRSSAAPRSAAAVIERLAAGLPSTAWVPAEMNRSGMPVWRCISRRANPSAVAERQRLPVHTNSTLKVGSSSVLIGQQLPDDALDLGRRDRAFPEHAHPGAGKVDDRRGRAAAGRTGVEEHVDVPAEVLGDLL